MFTGWFQVWYYAVNGNARVRLFRDVWMALSSASHWVVIDGRHEAIVMMDRTAIWSTEWSRFEHGQEAQGIQGNL